MSQNGGVGLEGRTWQECAEPELTRPFLCGAVPGLCPVLTLVLSCPLLCCAVQGVDTSSTDTKGTVLIKSAEELENYSK